MQNKKYVITPGYISALILALLFFSNVANANVGKVIYGYGDNYALDNDGNRRAMKKGAEINEGDTLVTGRGRMQIRLIDGGFVSIYPNSEYKIEQYKFNKTEKSPDIKAEDSENNRGFFNLIKGAARQVTGILGRKYHENFKFRTTIATIGIRGTGFFAQLCQADCFDADGNPLQDGLYVKNNTGLITMTTNVGDVVLAQGQSAFAASSEDSPQQTIQPPIAYNIVTPDIELYDFDEKVVDTKITDTDLVNPPVVPPVGPPPPAVKYMENIVSTDLVSPSLVQVYNAANPVDIVIQNGDAIEHIETVDDAGFVTLFDKGSAVLVDKGFDVTLGVIWNRWSGAYIYDDSGVALPRLLNSDMHIIGADNITPVMPVAGRGLAVTYVSTGGTSPTMSNNVSTQTGTQTITATIDYVNQAVTKFQLDVNFVNAQITTDVISGQSIVFLGATSGNVVPLIGTCTGTDCSAGGSGASVTGDATINLVGANAEGIFGVYNLLTTEPNLGNAISGSYLATEAAAIAAGL